MKMQSCTEEEFKRIMYGAGGKATKVDAGHTHCNQYYERHTLQKGWQVVGIERTVCGEKSYEVPSFLYEAYCK